MDLNDLAVLPLHRYPQYLKPCCYLINDEWPRSETARMMSLQASCDQLPTSLILLCERKHLLGHCKLTPIPSMTNSCFIETVVISKSMRGKKLGTYLMKRVEEYCKNLLRLEMVHLSTKGQEEFYEKLGYQVCAPVNIYGTCIPSVSVSSSNSSKSNSPVPSKSNTNYDTASKIPTPPPPPMPKPQNVNNSIKTNKTFMFKYL